jgi:flagellar M-ring protein FliF
VNGIVEFIKTLGPARIAAMGVVSALLLGFFGFVILRVSQPVMAPLYSELTLADSAAIVKLLDAQGVQYELKNDGAQVLVPKDKVARLRMTLAEKGVPAGGSVGYEIFDKSDALGTTSFVQNINHLRALEGELARTIGSIDRVSSARVHLVIPDRQLFQRERKEPTAAIALKLRGQLEAQQIRAIQYLVAAAVEGLKPGRVSVVDENGRLLAAGIEEDPQNALAATLQDRQQAFERKLETQVEGILTSIVGNGRARVRVTADLDFSRVTQTSDTFDPNGQVVRSEQTEEEASSSAQGDKGVSVGNQVPGNQANQNANNGTKENSTTTKETRNYDNSKTTRTEVTEAGRIKRLSVAVLVDGVYTSGNGGELTYAPRQQADLDQISAYVRSAVGFDQNRGDQVQVVNLRFAEPPASLPLEAKKEGWASLLDFTKDDIMRFAEMGVLSLMTLLVLLVVVRPLLKQVTREGSPAVTVGADGSLVVTTTAGTSVVVGADGQPVAQVTADGTVAPLGLPGTVGPDGALSDPGRLDQAKAAGALHATSIAKVGEMVQEMPNEAAALIRSWLAEG